MSFLRRRAVNVVPTGDAGTDRVQDELDRKARELDSCPLLRGVQVSATLIPNVPQAIPHKLGRKPQGYLVTDLRGDFGPAIMRNAWDERTITLVHGGAANLTLTLWVF